MKHSIAVKFIAIVLCALSLVAVAGSVLGIVAAEEFGLYSTTPDAWKANEAWSYGYNIAYEAAQLYAAEALGNCSEEVLEALGENQYYDYSGVVITEDMWSATISLNGQVLVQGDADLEGAQALHYSPVVYYPVEADVQYTVDDDEVVETAETAEWTDYVVVSDGYNKMRSVRLEYYEGPVYDVTLYLQVDKITTRYDKLVDLVYEWRYTFIATGLIGLLAFAVTLVYLCWAAGRKTGTDEIMPAGLNRMPLDLYAVLAVCAVIVLAVPILYILDYWGYNSGEWSGLTDWAFLCGLCAVGMALAAIGFLFAIAAQVKVKNGYWWRHSICGWFVGKIAGFFHWIGRGLRYVGRGCRAVFRLLPVIWQWLLVAFLMVLSVGISFFGVVVSWGFWNFFWSILLILSIAGCIAVVCYGGYCFGTLMKGAKAMAQGDLNKKVNTRYMIGAFKDFAIQLNNLAGAAQIAAERQMKSERMKTELITNVSHDIKTPLTSIINYVDLLKKPHTEAEGGLYLEVLDRQSQRLKKLIDDLMEMSKANTGNLAVEIGRVDAVEAVNQALGEFADKLAAVNLTPVFRYPDFPVTMQADGRLVWRVLSNLLSNAVKYALPDTRLYIDLMVLQGNAVIAIKNISRDQLNVNADELMERFVRGDSSRNTEGSGLGLNIAKSLVELQHGQMHLMVDGDLFKVTLIFPCG